MPSSKYEIPYTVKFAIDAETLDTLPDDAKKVLRTATTTLHPALLPTPRKASQPISPPTPDHRSYPRPYALYSWSAEHWSMLDWRDAEPLALWMENEDKNAIDEHRRPQYQFIDLTLDDNYLTHGGNLSFGLRVGFQGC